jgi:hypothetical protein
MTSFHQSTCGGAGPSSALSCRHGRFCCEILAKYLQLLTGFNCFTINFKCTSIFIPYNVEADWLWVNIFRKSLDPELTTHAPVISSLTMPLFAISFLHLRPKGRKYE